jgi:zinc protease
MGAAGHYAAPRENAMKPGARVLLILLLALLPALPAAAADAASSWQLGTEPRAFILDNGMTVIQQQDASAPITVVQLLVRGGDNDDPPGCGGLAFLTARLGLEITEQAGLQQLMDFGSSFSLSVMGDYSLVTIRSLSRHLDATLDVLTGMMNEPLISDMRVGGLKDLLRHLQKMEDDDPDALMVKTLAAAYFGASGYGAARYGDEASLERIGRKEIQSFFRGHYVAGNMVAVVISDLDAETIKPLLARRLGRFPAGVRPPSRPLPPRRPPPAGLAIGRQTEQTLVSLSALLPELDANNFLLAALLESWLGKGIGSQLWPLRSRGNLAYGLSAELQPNRDAMLLNVYLKTEARRSAEARAELERLLAAIARDGCDAAGLESAKAYAKTDFWRENEGRERRAATMAFLEGAGLSWRLAGEFAARLESVGLEEFNAFLRAWLAPERWFSLLIGPETEEANSSNK